ncbi:ser/Thr protein phosphatase-like protein superfamily [Rhexocercosporidium sp. MPI-PUGE-AT-0058]|nr:ser/Thr protein phosphatase-like protein superfamily [Rhexocercosporidium sp. MPI-PUGE-AT-0058]
MASGTQISTKHSTGAPYLILAGDIGRLIDYKPYLGFLAKQTAQFEKDFLVLGNHEFYCLSSLAGPERAQKLEKEAVLKGKLVLLHQRRFNVPNSDITVLGCTLWSRVTEDARETVRMKVKDFEKIEAWTVDDHNTAHDADLTWLRLQVSDIKQQNTLRAKGERARRVLVVTHHAPSIQGTSSLANAGNPWSSAFATDLLGDSSWDGVKAWVFGHTHFTTQFERNGIKALSNQRGYVLPGRGEGKDEGNGKNVFDLRRALRV